MTNIVSTLKIIFCVSIRHLLPSSTFLVLVARLTHRIEYSIHSDFVDRHFAHSSIRQCNVIQ